MSAQYLNRCGEVYFIQAHTRQGKVVYSASRKPTGKAVERLPEGYEVYERPEDAQVFVRKIRPTRIPPIERQLVEASISRLANLELFVVTVEDDSIVVYLSNAEPDTSLAAMREFAPMTTAQVDAMRKELIAQSRYVKMMRFTLTDERTRQFSVDRWCFLGSIDKWFPLAYGKPLVKLLETYAPHLGKESFFELM